MKKYRLIVTTGLVIVSALVFVYQRSGESPALGGPPPAVAEVSAQHSARWHHKSLFKRLRGVAVVVHGLNLKPERMTSLIRLLNRAGIEAVNVSLYGHGDNYLPGGNPEEARLESFRSVTYALWSSEVYEAYRKAHLLAKRKKVPVFFIGYSLGGLLGCELIVSRTDVRFDRMVLLAPALKIQLQPYLLKVLLPFPDYVLDSLSPIAYRANKGTPMSGYKALFAALERFEKNLNARLNLPTVVFLDPEDEFISYEDTQALIEEKQLDRWTLRAVQKTLPVAVSHAHHLLIDEAVLGKAAWTPMGEALVRHLLSPAQRLLNRP
ncbi:MAG: alpha/beta fold hydrolase [Deltaproteobacteria bacterium]|nr:alpha/beta fold hydrolase [Deltaproteobacteria bacterium]